MCKLLTPTWCFHKSWKSKFGRVGNLCFLVIHGQWWGNLASGQKLPHGISRIWITIENIHDDVIKWKHFPRYWPFLRGIHRWPVNSPHKGQWRGALMFSLICTLYKRLSKQSWGWWFETPSRSLWRHCNAINDTHFFWYRGKNKWYTKTERYFRDKVFLWFFSVFASISWAGFPSIGYELG